MAGKNISIKQISELSGVSVATVSRVINQNGRFSKETEKRVLDIIKQYNYQPNLLARGLRTNRIQTVGIVVPDISNEYFAKISLALQKNLFQNDYAAIICNTSENYEVEQKNLAMLNAQQVSGLIYIAGGFFESGPSHSVPTVFIDRKPPFASRENRFALIESDNVMGGYLAAKAFIEKGCKRIGALTYKNSVSTHKDRIKGFKQGLMEAGLAFEKQCLTVAANVSIEDAYVATRALFAQNEELDGLFCSADLLAYGAIQALDKMGIMIPEQVKLVGFDDLSTSGLDRISLTTIRQPVEQFGKLAAEKLIQMIEGSAPATNRYVLPVELIVRKST